MNIQSNKTNIIASDIAKYFLYRSIQDGDLITPLKMQKLIYYAYVWTLVKSDKKLFDEKIQAWPNGPVVGSLYQELRNYGSAPIDAKYLGVEEEKELDKLFSKFSEDIKSTIDEVYEKYIPLSAFELVTLTHSEKPWLKAREGLGDTEPSNNTIDDEMILEEYGKK